MLVVDDEAAIVGLVTATLRQAGYEAIGSTDPRAMVDHPPPEVDVLFVDYKMPQMTGLDLFGRLRLRFPNLVGVLSTGYGNLPLVRQAMQTGFSAILLKPFPLDRIPTAVERALGQRRLREENEWLVAALDVLTASTALSEAHSRLEAAQETCRLASERVGATRAAVLLASTVDGSLQSPVSEPGRRPPDWALSSAGKSLEAALAEGLPEIGSRTAIALPLRCGESTEGVLAVERLGRPFSAMELEQLSLLADQAALMLSNLSQIETRLRDEKLVLVGNMAGAICERLRAPLRHIEAAMAEVDSGEEEYLSMIRQESHRLELMCMELSDFVSGAASLRMAPCSLRGMLEALAARARVAAGESIAIEVDAPQDAVLPVDERKLGRAVQNLIKNANEAMADGGTLRLGLRVQPQQVAIEVCDDGCGMSAEVQAQVFEPFYTFGKAKGTGLGGAVVQSAVAAHRGRIEIDSEVGRGTTFRLILPRVADDHESHSNGNAGHLAA